MRSPHRGGCLCNMESIITRLTHATCLYRTRADYDKIYEYVISYITKVLIFRRLADGNLQTNSIRIGTLVYHVKQKGMITPDLHSVKNYQFFYVKT